jgi:hypothetical protein
MPDDRRTIDQRLEGLTQTVEILAGMQRDNEKRFEIITRNFGLVGEICGSPIRSKGRAGSSARAAREPDVR